MTLPPDLIADAAAISVPTLMFVAGADWVVKAPAQKKFFDRLSSPVKRIEILPGFYHAIFHEKEPASLSSRRRGSSFRNVLRARRNPFRCWRPTNAGSPRMSMTACAGREIRCSS